MDLGFGAANQVVGQATANALLKTAQVQESLIDDAVDQYDALLDDDDALDALRDKRLKQLQQQQQQRTKWQHECGHGTYEELVGGSSSTASATADVAKAFFHATKQSERLVVHFHRPATALCHVFHKHLTDISARHLETKFLKVNVEAAREGNQSVLYLVEQLGITIMPTIILICNRKVVHQMRGCEELGHSEDFPTILLKQVLASHGVLHLTDVDHDALEEAQEWLEEQQERGGKSMMKMETIRRGYHDKGYHNDDSESE